MTLSWGRDPGPFRNPAELDCLPKTLQEAICLRMSEVWGAYLASDPIPILEILQEVLSTGDCRTWVKGIQLA